MTGIAIPPINRGLVRGGGKPGGGAVSGRASGISSVTAGASPLLCSPVSTGDTVGGLVVVAVFMPDPAAGVRFDPEAPEGAWVAGVVIALVVAREVAGDGPG